MKKDVLSWAAAAVLLMLITCSAYGQWNSTGNSSTTGTVMIGTGSPVGKLDINIGTSSSIYPALNVYRGGDPNMGIRVMTGTGDNTSYTEWNGGLGSWNGIGFHCTLDGITRGVFDTRNGNFFLKGSINAEANASIKGYIQLGENASTTWIGGPGYSGAIQIKTNTGVGGYDARYLRLGVRDNAGVFLPVLSITDAQNIGIGTTNPDAKLTVKGKIHTEEVKVDLSVPGPDYVFEKDYRLMQISEIERYLQMNKHLPEVPSACEMAENGIELGEMNMVLLKKIEELTLYLIEEHKENERQKQLIENYSKRLDAALANVKP